MSSAAVDSTYDLRALRNELDGAVRAIGDLADEIRPENPLQEGTGDKASMKRISCARLPVKTCAKVDGGEL